MKELLSGQVWIAIVVLELISIIHTVIWWLLLKRYYINSDIESCDSLGQYDVYMANTKFCLFMITIGISSIFFGPVIICAIFGGGAICCRL